MSPEEIQNKFVCLERKIDHNTLVTNTIKSDTGEMVEIFKAFKGGLKVLEYIGKLAKPITTILAAIAAGWAAVAASKISIISAIQNIFK